MTERKSEINSLVPKKEASLVLVSNSLQITNKLLSESKFQFYWDFQAKLKLSYELDNSKKFIHPFIDTKNNFFKTLYSDGRVIKYSLFDGQKLEEKKELQEYLNANFTLNKWSNYPRIGLYFSNQPQDEIYLSNSSDKILKYSLVTSAIEDKFIVKDSLKENPKDEVELIIHGENKYCLVVCAIHSVKIRSRITTSNYLYIVDKKNFEIVKVFKEYEDRFYNNSWDFPTMHSLIVNETLFAGNQFYDGLLQIMNIENGENRNIKVSNCGIIEEPKYIKHNNSILFFSNYNFDNTELNSKVFLFFIETETIKEIKVRKDKILKLSVSYCGNYFGIFYRSGLVQLYDSHTYNTISEFIFKYDLHETEREEKIESFFLVIEYPNVYVANNKVMQVYE